MISAKNFPIAILSGRARITVTNPATGQWVKIHMRQRKDRNTGQPSNCFFLSLTLLGDGEQGSKYVGAYFADSGRFKLHGSATARERQIAEFLIRAIRRPELLATAEIEHAGQCLHCGRTLTVPESIRSGYGPECFSKLNGGADPWWRNLSSLGLTADFG